VLIEINLAPGNSSSRLGGGGIPGLKLPTLPAWGGDARPLLGAVITTGILAPVSWHYIQMGEREATLATAIQQEAADSAAFASTIALMQSLRAQQDTVRRRIEVIRGVDSRRLVWPRLMHEISVAIPPDAWLTEISSMEAADATLSGPHLTLQGYVGSTQALTRFMKNLEGSAFVRDVTLITTHQEEMEGRTLLRFGLEAVYVMSKPGMITTIPLAAGG
jgi:Tfp pilus assembly protein PilN